MVSDKVLDKKLYERIKKKMQQEHKRQGKRWGIYSSSQLVARYKKAGGKYKGIKPTKLQPGISRWYKEKWINVCKLPLLVKCGRSQFDKSGKTFPYCRPLHRVSKYTPKTAKELSTIEIKKRCQLKKKSPTKILRR